MAAAVVVRMSSMSGLLVATTSQLAMSKNSGDGVCVEHASCGERYSGIGHIQQTCLLQSFEFLSVVIDNVAPERILIPLTVDLQRGQLASGMQQLEIA